MSRGARLSLVLGLATLVAGLVAVVASAFWTRSAAGPGAATTGAPLPVTVQAATGGSPSSLLMPGATGDLVLQVDNPNAFAVTIITVQQSGDVTVVGGGATCTGASSGVTVPTQTGLSLTLAPGTQVLHLANGAAMSIASDSGCQGASFHIPVALAVQR